MYAEALMVSEERSPAWLDGFGEAAIHFEKADPGWRLSVNQVCLIFAVPAGWTGDGTSYGGGAIWRYRSARSEHLICSGRPSVARVARLGSLGCPPATGAPA